MASDFHWSRELELGVPALDTQHRRLVELLHDLARLLHEGAPDSALVAQLGAAAEFVARHFEDEERLMQRCGFPADDAHIAHHRELSDQFARFSRRLLEYRASTDVRKTVAFLRHWVYHHITHSDRELAAHLATGATARASEPPGRE